jgi:chemotaxis protein MotB
MSDLMMTMFILFAVLFAYHVSQEGVFDAQNLRPSKMQTNPYLERESIKSASQGPHASISELFNMSKRTLGQERLDNIASVELIKDNAVMIVFPGDVLFDSGQADLKPQNITTLNKVAKIIKSTPYVINIIGHTDNVPIRNARFASNWQLSTARACVTADYLIHQMGIDPTRIYAAGHAENKPIRSNHTDEGRAANRRVEIIISKDQPYLISNELSLEGQKLLRNT